MASELGATSQRFERMVQAKAARPPHLLFVDDNADDVFLTLRAMDQGNLDVQVSIASDGSQAMELLADSERLPAAILINFRLPGLNGVELIARLREAERTRDLALILLMGSAEERDHICREECHTGADACLVKPVTCTSLRETLMRVGAVEPEAIAG